MPTAEVAKLSQTQKELSHGRHQSIMTPAAASSGGQTQNTLAEGAVSPHLHLAVIINGTLVLQTQQEGSCLELLI